MSALGGIRVLELAERVSGEYCGKLLADFGATVVKVERPRVGSPTRHLAPFAPSGEDPERSGLFAYLNTNKQSVALDLDQQSGSEALAALLAHVDVVIDDHDDGWLAAHGLYPAGVADTFPALVLCAITPFGQSPPAALSHAEDLTVFHASGWGFHTPGTAAPGQPPLKGAGRFLPSYEAGLEAAMCIVAALHERAGSRLGRFIDVSQRDVLASRADYVLAQMVAGDMPVSNDPAAFNLQGPGGIFPCRDGFAYIWMSAPAHWDALRALLGNPGWMDGYPEHWLERDCTAERVAHCRAHVADWLLTQDKHMAAAAAQKLGLTLVAVNNARDLHACAQFAFRGFFAEVEHPVLGRVAQPTVPYLLSATPARIHSPAPRLGEHTDSALAALASGAGRRTRQTSAPPRDKPGTARGGPLQGVRVVELTKVWAGPYVGKVLAFLGAEVIRVESENSLDVTRVYGVSDIDNAPGFQAVNPQKLSVRIDMKTAEGVGLIRDLLARSDIVVENLRPGAIARLGLGYDAVRASRPDIVYVSMGMYGNDGPLAYQTGYAPCFAALGGLSSLVGYEGSAPTGMNIRYADSTFGTAAAYAALVALLHRRQTGEGQFVDVSAVEVMSSMIGDALMEYALTGAIQACDGNRHAGMAPHGAYPSRDGAWISIAVSSDAQWRALAEAMGRPELAAHADHATLAARQCNAVALDQLICGWTAGRDAATLAAELQQRGIAACKSLSSLDLVADAGLWARGFYRTVHDAAGQQRTIPGPGWIMSRGANIRDGAPRLGEHNDYVLGELLGLSAERRQHLRDTGVTR